MTGNRANTFKYKFWWSPKVYRYVYIVTALFLSSPFLLAPPPHACPLGPPGCSSRSFPATRPRTSC